MSLIDEEFYCEKCNWFTYRHSTVPYVKPAPRCPRCGLQTRIATAYDTNRVKKSQGWSSIDANGLKTTIQSVHDEFTGTSLKDALAMTRDFIDPLRQAIVPRKTVLKKAETDNRRCRECKIVLLTGSDTGLCDVCLTMFNAIASQPGLREAHAQWEVENQRRIHNKQRLMRD